MASCIFNVFPHQNIHFMRSLYLCVLLTIAFSILRTVPHI